MAVLDRQPVLGQSTQSREEEADGALRTTVVRPVWAWTLTVGFLATIAAMPLLQVTLEKRRDPARMPVPLRVGSLLAPLEGINSARTPAEALEHLPRAQAIRDFETEVENASVLTEWILPPLQDALARAGAGNEKAYCGIGNWLFYRPDVDYVTGPGFLEPRVLAARERKAVGAPVHPDPVPAIVGFDRQLRERGIDLIVMPVPPKPVVQPERLAPRAAGQPIPLENPSYGAFCDALRRRGVRLFDPTLVLVAARRETGRPQFLETDTHWTPEAMERAAGALAEVVRATAALDASRALAYHRRPMDVSNLGDIALMLKLPAGQRLYAPERVRLNAVYGPDGQPWRPRRDADVLLLGDSYTAIYSLEGMGWGKGAGLGEQLSFALGRPIDRIAVNDGGSYTTREQLLRDFARGRDRLAGKRVVVWEFAMRNLMEGDWRLLDLPPAHAAP